jgi:NTE family protein
MQRRIHYYLFLVLLICCRIYSFAQERPKIGVVLSGGGARGLAHIGALKVLEEAGIQPDYIVGTSMGGIIAGLYASGYSAAEISQISSNVNWELVLSKETPLNYIVMEEKERNGKYFLTFPVIERKPVFPPGWIDGHQLFGLISGLTWNSAGITDFDSLVIPFRCASTNLVNSEVVLLDRGNLASALFSTMLVPMVFPPYKIDSMTTLLDGGIVSNFPVQDIVDMGADIIIGVYVGYYKEKTAADYRSLPSVLSRTVNIAGSYNARKQLEIPHILIIPELDDISGASFSKHFEIETRGENAARKKMALLKSLSDSLNNIGPPAIKKALPENDSLLIKKIKIENCLSTSPEFVLAKLSIPENSWINKRILNNAIEYVYGTLYYEKVTYRFEKEDDNFNLIVSVHEKPLSNFNFSLHYDNYYKSGMTLGYSKREFLFKKSKTNILTEISQFPRVRIDIIKHLGLKQKLNIFFKLEGSKNNLPVVLGDLISIPVYENRFSPELLTFYSFNCNHQMGLGISEEYSYISPSALARELSPQWNFSYFDIHSFSLKYIYKINHLNHMIYPTRGFYLDLEFKANLFSDHVFAEQADSVDYHGIHLEADPYHKLDLEMEYFLPASQHITLFSGLNTGLSNENTLLNDRFYPGGFKYNLRYRQVPFIGLTPNSIAVNNMIAIKLGVNFKVKSFFHFTGLINMMSYSNTIRELYKQMAFNGKNNCLGFGAGLTIKSIFGPISFFTGWNTTKVKPIYYLNLGFNL